MMIKFISFISLFFLTITATSQVTADLQILSSMGTTIDGGEATMGEVVISDVVGDNVMLSQGFHQNNLLVTTSIIDLNGQAIEVNIFPNPTSDVLHIHFQNTEIDFRSMDLVDMSGKRVLSASLEFPLTKIENLQMLDGGIYSVLLHHSSGKTLSGGIILVTH